LKGPITETAHTIRPPAVPVTVTLAEHLWQRVEHDEALHDKLKGRLRTTIETDLRDLGIPGLPAAKVRRASASHAPVGVVVHDKRCLRPPEAVEGLVHRLTGKSTAELPTAEAEVFVEVVATVVRELVRSRLSVLLGQGQAQAYAARLPLPDSPTPAEEWPPNAELVRSMLGPVLDLRISVKDGATVSDVLRRAQLRPTAECVEQLIAGLRPPSVEIRLHRECLKEMTLGAAFDPDVFPRVRDALFEEVGVLYPDFRFVLTDDLPPGAFAFRLNHIATPVYRFDLDYRPQPPAGAEPEIAVVYLGRVLSDELRDHADAFLHSGQVEQQMKELELFYPTLVRLVSDELSAEQIASYLRALLDEGESIRNLGNILEAVLRAGAVSVDPPDAVLLGSRLPVDNGGFDRRHPQLTFSFVRLTRYRAELRSGLGAEHRLVVHPVSSEVEDVLRRGLDGLTCEGEHLPAAVADQIVGAVWALGGGKAPCQPLLVSSLHLRRPLRQLLGTVAPDLRVIAIQEVPLGLRLDRQSPLAFPAAAAAPAGRS